MGKANWSIVKVNFKVIIAFLHIFSFDLSSPSMRSKNALTSLSTGLFSSRCQCSICTSISTTPFLGFRTKLVAFLALTEIQKLDINVINHKNFNIQFFFMWIKLMLTYLEHKSTWHEQKTKTKCFLIILCSLVLI